MVCLISNDHIQNAQVIMTLWGHVLDFYMKYCVLPLGKPYRILEEIRHAMISKFINPQFDSQCIIEIKEIKQALEETIWDFDQWFKMLTAKVSF